MIEIAAAMSMATSAFGAIKKAMETGREAQDMVDFFGRWFEAKDQLAEANQQSQNQPFVKKMFSGNSVEAQALQITSAKHKMKAMEKELYEYLLYTDQQEFYNDMMRERRAIRERRLREAQRRANQKSFWIDMIALVIGIAFSVAIIIGFIIFVS